MRKIMIGTLILILIVGIALTVTNGISLGNIQISSVKQLEEKDREIEQDMQKLKQMKEVTFSTTIDELTESSKQLKSKREEYASLLANANEDDATAFITAEKYQVEYLWVKLGNYATENGITLKLNILKNTTGIDGVYNLEFTLNGKYAGITEFIYQIENDDTLGFKIDKFALVPSDYISTNESKNDDSEQKVDTEVLTATFTVKEVYIDIPSDQMVESLNTTQETTVTTENNTVQ